MFAYWAVKTFVNIRLWWWDGGLRCLIFSRSRSIFQSLCATWLTWYWLRTRTSDPGLSSFIHYSECCVICLLLMLMLIKEFTCTLFTLLVLVGERVIQEWSKSVCDWTVHNINTCKPELNNVWSTECIKWCCVAAKLLTVFIGLMQSVEFLCLLVP